MKNILLTGRPGVGKTTVIVNIIEACGLKTGGFYTQEIREKGTRVGFEIITLSGEKGILAHVKQKSRHRVGKYRVNIKDLETIGVEEIWRAIHEDELIVIDEIGKMELFSEEFKKATITALDSEKPVLATIMERSSPFADKVKVRPDAEVFEMTKSNRDWLMKTICDRLKEIGKK